MRYIVGFQICQNDEFTNRPKMVAGVEVVGLTRRIETLVDLDELERHLEEIVGEAVFNVTIHSEVVL